MQIITILARWDLKKDALLNDRLRPILLKYSVFRGQKIRANFSVAWSASTMAEEFDEEFDYDGIELRGIGRF
jgi:hypothetical protein